MTTNLQQQANEQCTLDVEGKCEWAGMNCIDGMLQWRVSHYQVFNSSNTENNINFTKQGEKI